MLSKKPQYYATSNNSSSHAEIQIFLRTLTRRSPKARSRVAQGLMLGGCWRKVAA